MCVMGLQQEAGAGGSGVEAWVDELPGENSEDLSDVSTIASVDGDPSSLVDMMSAVKVLLEGLGEDVARDGLVKTPLRVAQAFQGATRGYRQEAKDVVGGALFTEPGAGAGAGTGGSGGGGGGCGGMVVVRNIELFALCESCLLPFRIRCHVAYIPVGERVVGLSKLSRVAELCAKKLQNPARFANEVAVALMEALQPEPLGVAVLVESWHLEWPGVKKNGAAAGLDKCVGWVPSTTYSGTGHFSNNDSENWEELVALLHLPGHRAEDRGSLAQPSSAASSACPFTRFDNPPRLNGCSSSSNNSNSNNNNKAAFHSCHSHNHNHNQGRDSTVPALQAMVEAAETLVRAVGEDPARKELRDTSLRFVRWLLTATQGSRSGTSGNAELLAGQQGLAGDDVQELEGEGEGEGEEGVVSTELGFPFCSQCEHHLLPFVGVVHVAYQGRKLDRGSVQRVVRGFSLRLQVQERLTREIAEAIGGSVMVVVEASHMCMLSRGVQQADSLTSTSASLGAFSSNSKLRIRTLQLVSSQTHS